MNKSIRLKPVPWLLFLAFGFGLLLHAPADARAQTVHVQYDNQMIPFPDAVPQLDQAGRIQVPLRILSEMLGYAVFYENTDNGHTVKLRKDQLSIELMEGAAIAVVNGQRQLLDSAPYLFKQRFYVPLRFLAEADNVRLDWKQEYRLVVLGDNEQVLLPAFQATAYSAAPEENGQWGAVDYFGNPLKLGSVAVDPDTIPLGSTLYIEGYAFDGLPDEGFVGQAVDIGGAVKGNRIDIFIPGPASKVRQFGVQEVKIHLLETP